MADMHTPLWAVSIQGPDDLVAAADYLTAVRVANAFNEWWAALKTEQPLHKYDPRMWAVPVEYIGDAESHAKWVAKPSPDYAPFFEPRASQDAETIKALREALMKAGQSAGFQYMTAETRDEIEAALANAPRCEHCDGTGDVHRADGEWLGTCTCAAACVGLVEIAP